MNEKEIQKLIEQRDQLLKDNPELQTLQDKIDKALENTKDPHKRIEIINEMMVEKLTKELLPALYDLSTSLANTILSHPPLVDENGQDIEAYQ